MFANGNNKPTNLIRNAFLLAAVVLLALSSQAIAQPAGSKLGAILELPLTSSYLMDAGTVLTECTAALEDQDSTGLRSRLMARRGEALLRLQRPAEAIKDFQEWLKLKPGDPWARWYLSRALGAAGRSEDAVATLTSLLRDDPGFVRAYATLAIEQADRGDNPEALRLLDCALRKDPKLAYAYYLRADIYRRQGEYERCLKEVSSAIRWQPFGAVVCSEDLYLLKGSVLTDLGRYEEALSSLALARSLNPRSWETHYEIWRVYTSLGQKCLALTMAKELVALKPADGASYVCECVSCELSGMAEDAKRAFDKATALGVSRSTLLAAEGRALLGIGDYKNALQHLDGALEGQKDLATAQLAKAMILAAAPDSALRDGVKAKKLAKDALESRKVNPLLASMVWAAACAECGEFDAACSAVDEVLKAGGSEVGRRKEFLDLRATYKAGKPFRMSTAGVGADPFAQPAGSQADR